MKAVKILSFAFLFISFLSAKADEYPWEKYGFKFKVVTLSNGKYQEFHDLEDVVEIGSVLYNTQTKQIVGFVEKDTLYSEADLTPHIVSRWISPDPLTEEYSSWSPYNYVMNNPIIFVDPDGQKVELGNLTSSQITKYNASISELRTNNPYFNTLYSLIEKSDISYHIYENGNLGTPGQFVPYSNTSGGKITFKSLNSIDESTAIEEFFHGFQNETYKDKGSYSKLSDVGSNVEFEAKFLKTMISTNIGGPMGGEDVQKLYDIVYDLVGQYNLSDDQMKVYFEALNNFVSYHKEMKDQIENKTGKRPKDLYDAPPTNQTPDAAFKILEETEKK